MKTEVLDGTRFNVFLVSATNSFVVGLLRKPRKPRKPRKLRKLWKPVKRARLVKEELKHEQRRNRRRIQVDPSDRAFQEHLAQEYPASLDKLLPLKARLAATDRLIDLIVYQLYGLTGEEVAVVEGRER